MPDPFLFDDLVNDDDDPALAPPTVPVYTTPIEQATFDIMELVDLFFRASVTVEEYDGVQKKIKRILTEAFDEKSISIRTGPRPRPLLVRPEADDRY